MLRPALMARSRDLWERVARAPVAFMPALRVVVSPESGLGPPGWVGIVVIGDAVIATAPSPELAQLVQQPLGTLAAASLTDPGVLRACFPVLEILGPACLAYLDAEEFRPRHDGACVELLDLQDRDLRQFLAGAGDEDVAESGLAEIASPAFAVRARGLVVAAAGYRTWPGEGAHLSVLTAAQARSRGFGRVAASAAVAHAIQAGLLPQWRARAQPSRRVARALGFRELGSQVSIHIRTDGRGDDVNP